MVGNAQQKHNLEDLTAESVGSKIFKLKTESGHRRHERWLRKLGEEMPLTFQGSLLSFQPNPRWAMLSTMVDTSMAPTLQMPPYPESSRLHFQFLHVYQVCGPTCAHLINLIALAWPLAFLEIINSRSSSGHLYSRAPPVDTLPYLVKHCSHPNINL